jgi:hypothetical protein
MKGILFLRLFVFWIIIFYSKGFEFNEELSQIEFNNTTNTVSIFNGKYFYYLNLKQNIDTLPINFDNKIFTINCSTFNETFNNFSFINLNVIINENNGLNFSFGGCSCDSKISSGYTIYSFQLLLTHYCIFYGNFLIISGIIVALYGNKFKLLVKIIFFIYLLYSFLEFISEFNTFQIAEIYAFYISVVSLILGTFFGILFNKNENFNFIYGIIFGLTFYNTLYYLILCTVINNLMIYIIFLLIFIIIFGVICQIFNSNEILFIIGTSISGSYFIISGLNCFLGGFYYYYFKIKDYYKGNSYWNSCIIYFILHIIQIALSILFQKSIKNIEKEGVDQAETTKKYINKNLSGSTYILNPNQTNDYNLSLTANYNKRDGAVFSDNNLSEIKENEDNSNENAELNEESNVSG